MNKKNFFLIGLVLVLVVVYVIFFTDWFRPKTILIGQTSRPRAVARGSSAALTFGLGDFYELNDVKVVSLAELQTNKFAPPLWHLVSDEGSDSVDHFSYGEKIPGMDPAIEGARPMPLQPGVHYRLYVAAGKIKGQHDFYFGTPPPNAATNK